MPLSLDKLQAFETQFPDPIPHSGWMVGEVVGHAVVNRRALMQRRHTGENHLNVPNLEFPKSGADIKVSVQKLIEKYLKKIETDKAEIIKIAAFRQIDVKALVEAKSADVIIATSNSYSEAITHQARGFGGGEILMKYNQDVNRITKLVQQIESYFYDKNTYLTVLNNLPSEPTFKLSWDELEELGFRSEDAVGAPDTQT